MHHHASNFLVLIETKVCKFERRIALRTRLQTRKSKAWAIAMASSEPNNEAIPILREEFDTLK